jgi:predicted amidohydrolase
MSTSVRFAAVQFQARKGDWDASASRLDALLARGLATGASLLVCPEMALTGYVFADASAAAKVAEPSDGRTFALASEWAKRHGSYVVIGYPELADSGRLYNSALIVDPQGVLLCNYRKHLLYEQDETWALPGDTPYPLLDTPFGTMTCGICMDLNDDGFVDWLFQAGPEILAFPTNWLDQGFDVRRYWRWRLQGYPCWLVAANTYGEDEGTKFRGRSAILDPQGGTQAFAPASGDCVLTLDLQF